MKFWRFCWGCFLGGALICMAMMMQGRRESIATSMHYAGQMVIHACRDIMITIYTSIVPTTDGHATPGVKTHLFNLAVMPPREL